MIEYISKYRQALMGIAILGVMVGHCKMDWPPSIISKAIGVLCYSVFTGGFLFLSGFGLYYSMSKNDSIKDFYSKRMKRVLVPWVCIAVPYFFFMDVIHSDSWSNFLWHVSTLSFWKSGNYSGMWYISVILALYLVYPFYHRIAYGNGGKMQTGFLLFIFGFLLVIEYLISTLAPDYYGRISVCMNMGIFFLGSYMASTLSNNRKSLIINVGGGISICLIADFVFGLNGHIYIIYNVLCICLWSLLFYSVQNSKIGNVCIRVFEWFGRYTLELYMIHLFLYYIMKEVLLPDVSNNILFPVAVAFAMVVCMPTHNAINKLLKALE